MVGQEVLLGTSTLFGNVSLRSFSLQVLVTLEA
jgi:hypothetical protein